MPDPATAMVGISAGAGLLSSGDDTVTQRQELPDFLKPYAPLYAQMGYNLSQQPFNPYPFETVAPFTQDQNAAMDMVRQRSMAGSPVVNAAQQQTLNTIGGQYLQQPDNAFMAQLRGAAAGPAQQPDNAFMQQLRGVSGGQMLDPSTNPYLQQTFDQAAGRITDAFGRGTAAQTDAQYARAGAFGGSAWNEMQGANQRALGDSLAGLASNIYGGAYNQERGRQDAASQFGAGLASNDFARQQALQQQAAQFGAGLTSSDYGRERALQQQASMFAPNLAAQDYRDAEALLNVGGMQQQLGQNYLTDDLSRFTQAQQYPYQQFAQFGQMFNPALGSQSTQTLPGVSPMAGAFGGALGGLGLYNMGQQAGIWGSGGGGGLLGSATAGTPMPGSNQLGSGTFGLSW